MIDSEMFFDGWQGIVRASLLAMLGYSALVLMLRLSRKRTLSQMNTFDLVYLVVMGDLLAIMILDDHVSLAQGLAPLTALIALQIVISWLTTRSEALERVVNGEPTLLVRRGRLLRDAMHAQRITEAEILSTVREHGVADLELVEAVVLETNGSLSVIHFGRPSRASVLADVPAEDEHQHGTGTDRRTAARDRRRSPGRAPAEPVGR
jgi:uncharacterized membrane protein YcaP (DUF421 family)